MSKKSPKIDKAKTTGGCLYTPHVYDSGRVSTCYFDTACKLKYVGMPFGGTCKGCDKPVAKEAS